MISNNDLKKYNKKNDYSYTFGAFPTFELLQSKPDMVEKVLVQSTLKDDLRSRIEEACRNENVALFENDKIINRICDKESCIITGVFRKYTEELKHKRNHVVLVNPGEYGNMGTIIRSCAGFGIHDIAVIEPAADIFNPKTVRASMGSLFKIRFHCYDSFTEYYNEFGQERDMYPFMLKGAVKLGSFSRNEDRPFTLIFGNESSGLDDSFLNVGKSVLIKHSNDIDSLNLSLAAGIAMYEFTKSGN